MTEPIPSLSPFQPDPSSSGDLRRLILTRQQVLTSLVLTFTLLVSIAALWLWIGKVTLIPVHWSGIAFLQGSVLALGILLLSGLLYVGWPAYRAASRSYMQLVVTPLHWWDLPLLGLLPSVSEEILFRGVALGALGLTPLTILLTSGIFGILHLTELRHWVYGVWAAVLGILLAASLMWTSNLLVPMVAHALVNIVAGYWWKRLLQAGSVKTEDP